MSHRPPQPRSPSPYRVPAVPPRVPEAPPLSIEALSSLLCGLAGSALLVLAAATWTLSLLFPAAVFSAISLLLSQSARRACRAFIARGRGLANAALGLSVLNLATVPVFVVLGLLAAMAAGLPTSYNIGNGRAFRRRGRARAAPDDREHGRSSPNRAWSSAPGLLLECSALPYDERDALHAAWLADARAEHASVAAFARLTLELIALGAPPDLLERAQRAALDEVSHARTCFALASAYAGRPSAPGAWPEASQSARRADLRVVALEALVDGCLYEGYGAALLRAAARTALPELREYLERIAADEARHADLSWSILEWALASGEPAPRRAIERALDTLPELADDSTPTEPSAAWLLHGRVDRATAEEHFRVVRVAVLARARRLLADTAETAGTVFRN